MESNQKYFPEFGYINPQRTKEECTNPAFMDKHLHRVGRFAEKYHEDGLKGYSCIYKCVNCGKRLEVNGMSSFFIPSNKLQND